MCCVCVIFFNKAAPYKYGFDKWDVQVIDSDLKNKIARTDKKSGRKENSGRSENRCPNVGAQTMAIERMDVIDSSGVKITTHSSYDVTDDTIDDVFTESTPIVIETNDKETCCKVPASNSKDPEIIRDTKKVPLLYSGKYFRIEGQGNGVCKACCMTCGKVYSARENVSSNLVTHLKVCFVSLISFTLRLKFDL